jgi:tetratricopeptide (TPR) repeat protein
MYSGYPSQALEYSHRSIQAYREARDLGELGLPISYAGWLSGNLGNLGESLSYGQELIQIGRDTGASVLRLWGETILGDVYLRRGKLPEAVAYLRKALELAKTIPDFLYHILAGTLLAVGYLLQGDWQAALSELDACQRFAEEHNVVEPYGRVSMINNLAEVYLFIFEHGGRSDREVWLEKAGQACQAGTKASAGCRLKIPKAYRLQGTYEWLKDKPAAAQRWWQKSLAEAEKLGMRQDIGWTHLEMGRRLNDRSHLEKAERIFEQIGAELDLAKVTALLHP